MSRRPQRSSPYYNKVSKLPQKCIGKLIDMYRDRPCLWNFKIPEYRDYNMKSIALFQMTAYAQQFDPTIEQRDVVKKLESLRSGYRAELKKVRLAMAANRKYMPRLWFFAKMSFLPILSRFDATYQTPTFTFINGRIQYEPASAEATEEEQDNDIIDLEPEEVAEKNCVTFRIFNETHDLIEIKDELTKSGNADDSAGNFDNSTDPSREESARSPQIDTAGMLLPPKKWEVADEYDAIGVNIAAKLRGLSTKTRVIAEKLINDVLFHAQMDTLNPYTLLANTNEFTD